MPKKSKLKTPEWILEGFDSEEEYLKKKGIKREKRGKTFKVKLCPRCRSSEVGVVLSNSEAEEGGGKEWECKKCGWKGENVKKEELSEEEFLKLMEEK